VITVILGIIGALIGSFGNVVIYRLPLKKSVVWPGSSCPKCGHKIKPWENIPILSWLFLRGKCSNCKNPISIRYPFIEALTAAGFVILALRFPVETYGLTVFPLLAIYAMLVMMSMIDIDLYILPDSLTLPALIIGILGTLLYVPESGLPSLMPALAGGLV
jgi:leader peptidase (prepilin peptidase) / N-methyltransferase